MFLSRHFTPDGARWAVDGMLLPASFDLGCCWSCRARFIPSPARIATGERLRGGCWPVEPGTRGRAAA